MQYIDLQPFEDFIRRRNLVDDRHLSFYLNWVMRFLRSELAVPGGHCSAFAKPLSLRSGDWEHLAESDLLQCFSDQLARDDSLQDWQRRQAVKAVELYLNVFMPEQNRIAGILPASDNLPAIQKNGESGALERMKNLLKLRHYSARTLQTYTEWVQRYFQYAKSKKLEWNTPDTVRSYLSYLATQRDVAASTQNQAFNSILFLFRETLKIDLPDINSVRARRGPKLPVVLAPEETQKILAKTEGTIGLMLKLTYGAGLRVSELVRLRVQDIDFGNETLLVRSGKGDKDRATILPAKLVAGLKDHLAKVRALHENDLAKGFGTVWLPGALARKYPNAPKEWKWQYAFPAKNLSVDPESGQTRRYHVSEQVIQRALRDAAVAADVPKRVTVHTLRHSFATHLLMQGVNIREVQELLGHQSVETTMIYTHVVRTMGSRPKSPLDTL
jgi:integron integrase